MFAKKLSGKNDVEAALRRLDILTQEETRIATAQTLGVVNRLATESAWYLLCCRWLVAERASVRWPGVRHNSADRNQCQYTATFVIPPLVLIRGSTLCSRSLVAERCAAVALSP